MTARPLKYPEWARTNYVDPVYGGNNVLEPAEAKKDVGWLKERPPAQYMNWLARLTYQWLEYLDGKIEAVTITADYDVLPEDSGKVFLVDTTASTINVNLPDPTTIDATFKIYVKKITLDSNGVLVNAFAASTIDEIDTYGLESFADSVEIQCDAVNYFIIASYERDGLKSIPNTQLTTTIDLTYFKQVVLVDNTASGMVINLPQTTDVGDSFELTIKLSSPTYYGELFDLVQINSFSGDRIDENNFYLLSEKNESVTFIVSGNAWLVKSSSNRPAGVIAEVKTGFDTYMAGHLFLQDNYTVGSLASSATYAKDYYQNLFIHLYNIQDDSKCPVSGGRTGNAENDFNANKTLRLPIMGTMAIGVAGSSIHGYTTRALGDTGGEELHANTEAETFNHGHSYTTPINNAAESVEGEGTTHTNRGTVWPTGATTGSFGGSGGHNTIQPTNWVNAFIKFL